MFKSLVGVKCARRDIFVRRITFARVETSLIYFIFTITVIPNITRVTTRSGKTEDAFLKLCSISRLTFFDIVP